MRSSVLAHAPGTQTKSIVWATDLHLDTLSEGDIQTFIDSLAHSKADLLFISGDISEKLEFRKRLQQIFQVFQKPIYYVLGNHDYYHSSIELGRKAAQDLMKANKDLIYLTTSDTWEITPQMGLIGHDGWADGFCGDYLHSQIVLKDHLHIEELKGLNLLERLAKVNEWGQKAAEEMMIKLEKALQRYQKVIFVTHYPPFREACFEEGGEMVNDHVSPHLVCQAMGDVLWHLMQKHPENELLVLCGHAHVGCDTHILPNLRVMTGRAKVGFPSLQSLS